MEVKDFIDCLFEPILLEEISEETGKLLSRQFDFEKHLNEPCWKTYKGVPYMNRRLMKIEIECDVDSYYKAYEKEYLDEDEKPFRLRVIGTIPRFLHNYKQQQIPERIEEQICSQLFVYLQDSDFNFDKDYSDHIFVLNEIRWAYSIKNNILLYLDTDENGKVVPAWKENGRT